MHINNNRRMIRGMTRWLFVLGLPAMACRHERAPECSSRDIARVIDRMTALMVHDVTNPPLAARFYAYACLAGYEVVAENDRQCKSMSGVLNGYPVVHIPPGIKVYHYQLSALLAMMETAAALQPSGSLWRGYEAAFLDSCSKAGIGRAVLDSSKKYAKCVSDQVLAYAKSDRYNRISNYPRYTPKRIPGSWQPTPPSYMIPVEPYFNTIRPFTLDSATQFLPSPPIPFSSDKHSAFYRYLEMSYAKSGTGLTQQERDVASFWDCNPFAVQNDGHMLIGLKKISPGGHWMGITGIACRQAGTGFAKAMQIHTVVAVSLMDCFICCWEDKYRTNRIRPETAIREYIDPNWRPLLQTPPFPEYISGHSVVSATAAVVLSHYFGSNFAYTDNVEVNFGIPPRSFVSFEQAAKEAAISRFWGGIHFMDAIDNGLIQGDRMGNWVLHKIGLSG
jgi:hypothetical protein